MGAVWPMGTGFRWDTAYPLDTGLSEAAYRSDAAVLFYELRCLFHERHRVYDWGPTLRTLNSSR
jgi:hypothetical protein